MTTTRFTSISDYARAAGFPDVFAHGMLIMGYLGRTLEAVRWRQDPAVVLHAVRVAITWVGNAITCTATLRAARTPTEGPVATIALVAADQHGEIKLKGEATVAL